MSRQIFVSQIINPDKVIRPTFQKLREQVVLFGFDPQTLLHIGIPEFADGKLVSYDCCIEFPFPEEIEGVKYLAGGRYAVLTIEKVPEKIRPAIRQFHSNYIPEHELIPDEDRPVYEVYFEDLLE